MSGVKNRLAETTVSAHEKRLTPSQWYADFTRQEGHVVDAAQSAAVMELQRLFEAVCAFEQRQRWWSKLIKRSAPRGLYLWGGTGRGKSMLMDAFYAALPFKRKQRVHFHAFMREFHEALWRSKGESDPVGRFATRIAEGSVILCFDEFHISDIADAMLLQRLLEALRRLDLVLLMTSNYPPEGLYPDGFQREKFLPAIALLNQSLTVLSVKGGQDYRFREQHQEEVYFYPQTEEHLQRLSDYFESVAQAPEEEPLFWLNGRRFLATRRAPNIVWVDFTALCDRPLGKADYLALTEAYSTIIVSNVPKMAVSQYAAARRFTWFVDICFDRRIRLLTSAEVAPSALYAAGSFHQEFKRAVSRLEEMKTAAYLHAPLGSEMRSGA